MRDSRTWMQVIAIIVLLSTLAPQPAHAAPATYYVSENGSDSANDGLTPTTPFKTLQKAADLTMPGDTVYVLSGTYTPSYDGSNILTITRSGTASAPITYAAYPGATPRLHVPRARKSWNHISVFGASYITIDGLTLEGDNANITYAEAYAARDAIMPEFNTNGIFISPNTSSGARPHHITVRNLHVSNMPGCGICTSFADYVTIEDNVVHATSWYTVYATSGISIFHSYNSDSATGYKNFVRRNRSYDNETYIPWKATGDISDGNGIIIDDNKQTQVQDGAPYLGRTLVENNIVYTNGGSGIHAYSSAHVDIINNSAYQNSHSPDLEYANIFASSSDDVRILNNIAVARAGEPTNVDSGNSNVTYDYNIYYNGAVPAVVGAHDRSINPLFVNPSIGDLRLSPLSPAIDSGSSNYAPSADISGIARPQGAAVDRGAYEYPLTAIVLLPALQRSAP